MISISPVSSNPHNLRPHAHQPTAAFSPGAGRTILSPHKTATVLRSPGHDCSLVNSETTAYKVMARLAFSLHRFVMAFVWECTTFRGKTKYNGGTTKCGHGKCEAGHAALSPTLYDNKLELLREELNQNAFQTLKIASQTYLQNRFALDLTDITQLSNDEPTERLKWFDKRVTRLSRRERKGSIIGTAVEFLRNSTFSNPRASNRVDCYLEARLRRKEDELADKCTTNQLSPEEALVALVKEYQSLLKIAQANLQKESEEIKEFQKTWDDLITSHTDVLSHSHEQSYMNAFKIYLERADRYVNQINKRMSTKKMGVPQQRPFLERLKQSQSPRLLQSAIKAPPQGKKEIEEWFAKHSKHLVRYSAESDFKKACIEVEQRHLEATVQLQQISLTDEEIHVFVKNYLSEEFDNTGHMITPSKEKIAQSINTILRPALYEDKRSKTRKVLTYLYSD